jgi:tetratricopeptide (TPR) repeat protein
MTRQQRRASSKPSAKTAQNPPKAGAPAAYFEAGLRLLQAGQLAEAERHGRQALAIDPGHADSLHLMGLLCFASRQYDLAIEWFAEAIRHDPNVADYFSNLGAALQRQGRHEEAIKSFDRALALKPEFADAWAKLGQSLHQQQRLDEASLSFDQALKLDPANFDTAHISATLHFEAARYEQAIVAFDRLLAIKPDHATSHNYRGLCFYRLKRYEEALASCLTGFGLAPKNAEIANNVGLALYKLGRNEEALVYFGKALALNPAYPLVLNNRATSLTESQRFEEAIADLDAAIALDPQFADAHWNAALLRLLLGDFEKGWPGREWGLKCAALGRVERNFVQPLWLGEESIAGKTILVHSDEGLGDTIQFARYVAPVAARGARVILEVQDAVVPLLTGVEGAALCLPNAAKALPDFDYHCPMSSLPLALKTRLETIPAKVPYLPAPPQALRRQWQERLGRHDRLRVGLVWSGNPLHNNDRNRSTSLRTMTRLLDVEARFISLQKDPKPADKATLAERNEIVDLTEHLVDFVETAALISCLDLVITVDTSVAHLAGALGARTWILLPYTPDYRWLLDRDDSPWYPTARLFRQDKSRDYERVLDQVRTELQMLATTFEPVTAADTGRGGGD